MNTRNPLDWKVWIEIAEAFEAFDKYRYSEGPISEKQLSITSDGLCLALNSLTDQWPKGTLRYWFNSFKPANAGVWWYKSYAYLERAAKAREIAEWLKAQNYIGMEE